jgi:hypothetical protein
LRYHQWRTEEAGYRCLAKHLYSKKNAGVICISHLFGASQYWCFIAVIKHFHEMFDTLDMRMKTKGRVEVGPASTACVNCKKNCRLQGDLSPSTP